MKVVQEKLFYSISEVAEITGIKPYVLRYWESEFKCLHPSKSSGGQRTYKKKDIDTVLRIKKLLYEEGFTIPGAKKKLNGRNGDELKNKKKTHSSDKYIELLREIREDLRELL